MFLQAATSRAAAAIGWGDRIGSLEVGREADVTVLQELAVDVMMPDCCSQVRHCTTRILPRGAREKQKQTRNHTERRRTASHHITHHARTSLSFHLPEQKMR